MELLADQLHRWLGRGWQLFPSDSPPTWGARFRHGDGTHAFISTIPTVGIRLVMTLVMRLVRRRRPTNPNAAFISGSWRVSVEHNEKTPRGNERTSTKAPNSAPASSFLRTPPRQRCFYGCRGKRVSPSKDATSRIGPALLRKTQQAGSGQPSCERRSKPDRAGPGPYGLLHLTVRSLFGGALAPRPLLLPAALDTWGGKSVRHGFGTVGGSGGAVPAPVEDAQEVLAVDVRPPARA